MGQNQYIQYLTLSRNGSSGAVEVRLGRGRDGQCAHATRLSEADQGHLISLLAGISSWASATDGQAGKSCPLCRPEAEDLMKVGRILGPLLLGGPVGREVQRRLEHARSEEATLCLDLDVQDMGLRSWPWEVACLAGKPLCWHPDVLVVRREKAAPRAARDVAMAGTLRVLPLMQERSFDAHLFEPLREQLHRDSGIRVSEPLVLSDWSEAAERLSDRGRDWHVVIYAGHVGTVGDSATLSFGQSSERAEVFAEALASSSALRVVVLLGCSTWDVVAGLLRARGIPAVVGTHFYLPEGRQPALGLKAFLGELSGSGHIDKAFLALREALPEASRGGPVLSLAGEEMELFRPDWVRLGDYMREVRDRFAYLEVFADLGRLSRQELYVQRHLSEAARGEREEGGATETTDPMGRQPEPKIHAQSELLRQLCRPSSALRYCVTGDAGMGKTTLLGHLAWKLSCQYRDDPNHLPRRVPVPVDLGRWGAYLTDQPDKDCRTLLDLAHYCNPHLEADLLAELCRDGQAVFLLDGLDEARSGGETEPIGEWLTRQLRLDPVVDCSVVLSGRPWAWRGAHGVRARFEELRLEALKPKEIDQYVEGYFRSDRESSGRLRRHLESHPLFRRLVSRPLLLTLLCLIAEDGPADLPQSEGELLGSAVEEMLRRRQGTMAQHLGRSHVEVEACLRLLESLAWASWRSAEGRLTRSQALEALGDVQEGDALVRREFGGNTPGEIWERLVRHAGLLAKRGRSDYVFTEESCREYLAGAYLADQNEDLVIESFGRHIWNPAWTRVIRFMVGRLWRNGREALAERLIRWLVAEHKAGQDGRWGCLAREAGWMLALAPGHQQAGMAQLEQDLVDVLETVFRRQVADVAEDYGEVSLPPLARQISFLIPALGEDENERVRMNAAIALGEMGDPRALDPLVAALRNENEWVRKPAGFALAWLGGRRAMGG